MSDKELLRAFAASPSIDRFQPLVARYLAFVHAAACRQLGDNVRAREATRAVFLALANRARKLPRKTVLASWLFRATRFATQKLKHDRERTGASVPASQPVCGVGGHGDVWMRIAPILDRALDGLPRKQQDAVLARVILNWGWEESARVLRTSERRAEKRLAKGLRNLVRRLRKHGVLIEPDSLAAALAVNASAMVVPEETISTITASAQECFARKPSSELVRRVLRALAWARWKRRLKIAATCLAIILALLTASGLVVASLWRSGRLLAWFIESSARRQAKAMPEVALPARPWVPDATQPLERAGSVQAAKDLYRTTNIWLAHLKFSADGWAGLEPKRIPPLPNLMQSDGTILLRNPKAHRSGLAGALGYDFNWVHAKFELSGLSFANVAARFRGNGTYIGSLYGWKRSFKVDLDKFAKGQQLGGIHTINFANLIEDTSYMSDALAYELFRDTGAPAPRTAYAWLTVSAGGKWEDKPLGLYLVVENVDADFAADRFGSKKTPIFKPVTYDLFKYLGNDWAAYADIYDLKTKATMEQRKQVIEFARLLTNADEAEFQRRVGDFLDLDEFARFLVGLVLLASYDGFLTNGQNFFMYLDPHSNKFGFVPWDLDHAWGGFPFIGTAAKREEASIWRPWAHRNRFLERVMGVEEFRRIYRARLEEALATTFVPERLYRRIDQMAAVVRSPIAAESNFRLKRFDQAISTNWLEGPRDGEPTGPKHPVHQLKRFITNRGKSVREQLDGKSEGIVPEQIRPNQK